MFFACWCSWVDVIIPSALPSLPLLLPFPSSSPLLGHSFFNHFSFGLFDPQSINIPDSRGPLSLYSFHFHLPVPPLPILHFLLFFLPINFPMPQTHTQQQQNNIGLPAAVFCLSGLPVAIAMQSDRSKVPPSSYSTKSEMQ